MDIQHRCYNHAVFGHLHLRKRQHKGLSGDLYEGFVRLETDIEECSKVRRVLEDVMIVIGLNNLVDYKASLTPGAEK